MRRIIIFRAAGVLVIVALSIVILFLKRDGEMGRSIVMITESSEEESSPARPDMESGEAPSAEAALLYVYLTGAVRRPGVYTLPEGARLFEAVAKAGGLLSDADASVINEAAFLEDGQHVHVPRVGETFRPQDADPSSEIVNINTAGIETLVLLPGIGEAKAAAIVRYRTEHGAFSSIEDIMNVSGIGKALFEQIKDRIRVS